VLIKEPFVGPGRLVWREEFYAAIDTVAAEYGLPVVDPGPDIAAAGGASLYMDNVHPTAEGCEVIARTLERTIRDLLAPSAAHSR
jgi:lysophospholipase L1-like esterase